MPAEPPQIIIQELTTYSELMDVQKLENLIWNEPPIPLHQTFTSIQNGGLILGAYINETLVGFSYGFAGFKNGKSYLCSHILGIHPEHQEKGIGACLKEVQRQKSLELGYSMMTWTYDPLESRNGYFNLSKLHAICRTYVENCYGDMMDALNSGLPSDRFKVEWWFNSPFIEEKQQIDVRNEKSPFQIEITEKGLPKLMDVTSTLERILKNRTIEQILVPVPINFQQLKKEDFELALDWRLKSREILQTLFDNGYVAAAVKKKKKENVVNDYVLVKEDLIQEPRVF
ncbi:GNAT family N-acetyltransferase [Schinkia azotoformans]|uniref:GNAT family N-acetyltransferase n=1 Tax=Schinkia azotoformans TaxID=1454 RepID=UPI002DBB02E4|nr:GNAT family N-acetyltransferase [Schinkia azotoformans]MEC1695621.1 GNAT family N-acetyltransferase [Schinkia azotoformans]MEC1726560.1 GNAT family N-acetyltransferase [Schinkia azotoformans]MEC1782156.1 GNAT family N-acetyltransferase [Schinkia azotoformans]MED4331884.1 GNAT family N-acetyltransferase [Schinkia azotoformans]